jgi:glutaredoxin
MKMDTAKIEVFTSPTCPHCPSAKKAVMKFAEGKDYIKIVETSTATHEGQKRARQYEVRSVPTLFVTSSSYPDKIGYVGVPSENGLKKMTDIALGKDKWDEGKKEGIFSRIAKLFGGESNEQG